jgi:hypothetical protein
VCGAVALTGFRSCGSVPKNTPVSTSVSTYFCEFAPAVFFNSIVSWLPVNENIADAASGWLGFEGFGANELKTAVLQMAGEVPIVRTDTAANKWRENFIRIGS